MYAEDTIAAIATPPGPGGIGVIRVSGPAAKSIAAAVFRPTRAAPLRTHRMYHGRIVSAEGTVLDDALAVLMYAPKSYTGEDVLELHCHGSPLVLRLALESVLRRGARPACPGEFTKRAFLNGKLDLTQAEAVIDLVRARTPEGAGLAADQLFGHLSEHLKTLREQLVRVKAHLEVRIDFADEDIQLRESETAAAIGRVLANVDTLLGTYARGRLLRDGLHVAITGSPNVGKSSLLNALLGSDRAIVSAIPGTTRDVVEESANFSGVPVVLSDTAGLRDAEGEVERIGVDRARRVAHGADVVLLVFDLSRPQPVVSPPFDNEHTVAALNKIDLPCAWSDADLKAIEDGYQTVRVSALKHLGLDDLRRAVVECAGLLYGDGLPALTSSRQHDSLAKVRESLQHALASLRQELPPDLVAVDIQAALDHLGSLTGLVSSEEVLEVVFSEFCIGK